METVIGSFGEKKFADAGAYNGNAAVDFTRWCLDYKDIYIFEASEKQGPFLLDTMDRNYIDKYHLFMKGVSDCKKGAGFIDSEDGSFVSTGGALRHYHSNNCETVLYAW